MFDQPFTVAPGRAADAVEFLIANSALSYNITTQRHPSGELYVPAPPFASTGEAVLWELAKEIGGACGSVSLPELASRIDRQNLAAAYTALGMLFGIELVAFGGAA
ncbi:MAG: hypothetical protein ACTHJM_11880 [Marmoricola sp.]